MMTNKNVKNNGTDNKKDNAKVNNKVEAKQETKKPVAPTNETNIHNDGAAQDLPTPKVDVDPVREAIRKLVKPIIDTTEPSNLIWAKLIKLAEEHVDESDLPLEMCSQLELGKRLRACYAKRVPAKKAMNNTQAEYTKRKVEKAPEDELTKLGDAYLEAKKLLDTIDAEVRAITKFKTNVTSGRAGSVVSGDSDPSKLSQEDLNKYIRNLQSKKCAAKKANDTKMTEFYQQKVDEASAFRTGSRSTNSTKVVDMSNKIRETIAVFEAMEQTPEVVGMIEKLKASL